MLNLDKIKGKIVALLSKTVDNGATKAEMNSALEKANQLMLEFFITENDLKEKDKSIIVKCISKSVEKTKSGFDLSYFLYDLRVLFDCRFYSNPKTITFFGYESDVELCAYFYQMIGRTCLIEKERYLKSYDYLVLKKQGYHGKTLSASFILGFLSEVAKKMKIMYDERMSNIPQSYGLMVIDKKENVNNQYDLISLNFGKARAKKYVIGENSAFEQGTKRGIEFELIQGIEDTDEDEIETLYL